mmetsp:Transcript_31991/g.66767  ORF Transcript_31991/g.66767 Transcript_31991/m.66767 type:complete len:280 (-) Transcript_31991:133-972(-)
MYWKGQMIDWLECSIEKVVIPTVVGFAFVFVDTNEWATTSSVILVVVTAVAVLLVAIVATVVDVLAPVGAAIVLSVVVPAPVVVVLAVIVLKAFVLLSTTSVFRGHVRVGLEVALASIDRVQGGTSPVPPSTLHGLTVTPRFSAVVIVVVIRLTLMRSSKTTITTARVEILARLTSVLLFLHGIRVSFKAASVSTIRSIGAARTVPPVAGLTVTSWETRLRATRVLVEATLRGTVVAEAIVAVLVERSKTTVLGHSRKRLSAGGGEEDEQRRANHCFKW